MYKQLTEEKRLQIWAMRKEGKSQSEIARLLQVHRSTVSRELNRNSGPYGYEPQLAQRMAIYRKKFHQQVVERQYEELARELLSLDWDREQCLAFVLHHHPELTLDETNALFARVEVEKIV
ncbi:helix-turn-helix domain-containing protein [Vibrio sp. SCSIO 43137]|uniref:helix-turn-helix domain-containing protein n=1 Tax=Vibrio sp. SCSIO 43137 TaxID=3021011 RepID=UPI0023081E51|nr:helix-turn-helix domain-containing protein [Vibrio sp. SCSIO 43137]WCE31561.1 helix-turn-helix domain-containing protein [Vibrio sp. SCSIO 43137]